MRNMNIKRLTIQFLTAVSFFSCTVLRSERQPQEELPRISEYPDSLMPVFHYSEGLKEALIYGHFDVAVEHFRKAIRYDSTHAPSYYAMADILARNDPQKALAYSQKANRIDTTNLDYRNQLGHLTVMTGNYMDAIRIYNDLLRKDPGNPLNYKVLAALYEQNEQPFSAISVLDSAEYKLGRIEELAAYKRQLLIKVRLYDKAIEETNALITAYPYQSENYLILAELYASRGEDSLAQNSYEQALRIDSTDIRTLESMLYFYRQYHRNQDCMATMKRIFVLNNVGAEEKKRLFEEVTADVAFYQNNYLAINELSNILLAKYPNDFSIVDLHATHLIHSGKIEQALDYYKMFITNVTTSSPDPYFAILDIESYLQRPDSVIKYSDLALTKYPKNQGLYLRKSFAMHALGDTKRAFKTIDLAYRYANNDSVRSAIHGIRGDLLYEQGKEKKAYRFYTKALDLHPDNAAVLNNFAYFICEESSSSEADLEKALAMSERANRISSGNATYLDTQAWLLYKLGRYEEARKIMLQAISLDSSNSEVLLCHYGDILHAMGDDFLAKMYWRRALEQGYDTNEIEKRFKMLEK